MMKKSVIVLLGAFLLFWGSTGAQPDEDATQRLASLRRSVELQDSQSEDIVIQALTDACHEVREEAVSILGRLGSRKAVHALTELLVSHYEEPAYPDSNWMKTVGAGGIEYRVTLYDAFPWAIVRSLVSTGEAAIPALLTVLEEEEHHELRHLVAVALGRLGERKAVPVLIDYLENGKDNVRREGAARLLGDLGDERAIPALTEVMKAPPTLSKLDQAPFQRSEAVRYAAYRALLQMGVKVERKRKPMSVVSEYEVLARDWDPALVKGLESEDKEKRYEAALKLGELYDKRAVPVLIEILGNSRNFDERKDAARHLYHMRDKRAIPVLKETLEDDHRSRYFPHHRPVAEVAYRALLKMGVRVEKIGDPKKERAEYRVIEE